MYFCKNFKIMDWEKLITYKRLGQENRHVERHDERSEFKRDYDRLIFSAPFRRMQNKTQVFPLPGSVFVHNRLTHSLEVASVGMSLGNDVAHRLVQATPAYAETLIPQMGTIVSAACLAHDMGNPPFGHSGEKAIQSFFSEGGGLFLKDEVSKAFWDDITHFEGNANAFRILSHRFLGRREGGFAMTYSTLASIVKYPFASSCAGKKGKFGFFDSEKEIYQRIADEMGIICKSKPGEPLSYVRHPLVYLVEAADDICYEIMDIEDAHKLMILSFEETESMLLGFFDDDMKENIRKRIHDEGITDVSEKVVYMRYKSKPVLDVELSGYKILATLMESMMDAVMHPDRFYSKQLLDRVSSQYDIRSENLETRIMSVIDYVSGMTDVYALDVFQKINGISLPVV